MATTRRRFLAAAGLGAAGLGWAGRVASAGDDPPAADADPAVLAQRAVAFLRNRQTDEGSWSPDRNEPGITALVVAALLRSGRIPPGDPTVARGLAYLEQFLGDDGGFSKAAHANYTTSIALLAFHEADKAAPGRYADLIRRGQEFLKGKQWDESEGKDRADAYYGGAGYGGKNDRPDLSNTSYFLDALRDTGLPADDPALKRALIFVSRCQNLASEHNDQPWAGKVNDGGFVYTPAKGGQSMAGAAPDGGLRSYAGMTYAGLKSMIHAGLSPDDPRVKAALAYIQQNYTLDENPGLGQAGLFYYYHTFARALALLGQPTLVDSAGVSHDWRADLSAALAKRQTADGAWVNPADRFMEGDPNLVSAYGLLALSYARPPKA